MTASLLYHDVVRPGEHHTSGFTGPVANRYKLSTSAFDDHLAAIAATGTTVIVPRSGAETHDRPACILTFDDGGVSFLTEIAPRLEARGWRGCFFVTTNQLDRPGFLSHAQVLELHERGHVVGSHSHTHPVQISSLSRTALVDEWRRSSEILERILGVPTLVGSVPGGFFSKSVATAAATAGLDLLFNSEPTLEWSQMGGARIAGRLQVVNTTTAAAVRRMASGDGWLVGQMAAVWNGKKLLKRVAGGTYRQVSAWMFRSPVESPQ